MTELLENASESTRALNPHLYGGKAGKARPRPTSRRGMATMNRTEAAFACRLDVMCRDLVIKGWKFEAVTLKISDGCRYTPDFVAWSLDGVYFYEIKGGFVRDDAIVKFKAARELFPWAWFEMWQLKAKVWTQVF